MPQRIIPGPGQVQYQTGQPQVVQQPGVVTYPPDVQQQSYPYPSNQGGDVYGNAGGYGNGARPTTRSLFMGLFLSNFVPGLASGISDWFRGRVAGNATQSNAVDASGQTPVQVATATSLAPAPSDVNPNASPQSIAAPGAGQAAPIHAGVAFEVLLYGSDGKKVSVDPSQHVFASGQQFAVAYRPNFPGRVEVYNLDPTGKETLIDRSVLAAAELHMLGPYQFVPPQGAETLRIVLYPCDASAAQTGQTRGIVKAEIRPEVAQTLAACDAGAVTRQQAPATRSIEKVVREGGTAFALDPVSPAELASRQIAPRQILIRLSHK